LHSLKKGNKKMRKYPLTWFYVLAFGISWIGLIPGVLGSRGIAPFDHPYFQLLGILFSIGPTLAAVIMSQVMQGKTGVQNLLKGLLKWRVGLVWYLVAVLGPIVIFMAGQVLTKLMGLTVELAEIPSNPLLFMIALSVTILSNTGEEIGWRGFALPHLQKRYDALSATLIVGLLWSLWHLPLVFMTSNAMAQSPLLWLISIVASAFIYTWLYNSTQGSILLVALLHVSENLFGAFIPGVSPMAYALVNFVVAIALVAVLGKVNLSRRERVYAG
jgi:membrane protease YdiL (CAAX protease family)